VKSGALFIPDGYSLIAAGLDYIPVKLWWIYHVRV